MGLIHMAAATWALILAAIALGDPSQMTLTAETWTGLALLAVTVTFIVVVHGWRFRRSARNLNQPTSTARFDARRGARGIDSHLPIAITVGALRSRTLLSSGLLEIILARLVEAILDHELAHERRRDGLWKLATELLSFGPPAGTRRAFEGNLELAGEQVCDEKAGSALGDRTCMAEALMEMERVRQNMAGLGPAALGFVTYGVPARVKSLVSDSLGLSWNQGLTFTMLAVAVVAAARAADPLHHLMETLVHYVPG